MEDFRSGAAVHLWLVELREIEGAWPDWMDVLSPEEEQRAARYRNHADRRRFSLSRACLRMLLSRYIGVQAGEIDFLHGMYGKPHVGNRNAAEGLDFSVSHSGECALYGFYLKGRVGVDIEQVRDDTDLSGILQDICTAEELKRISCRVGREAPREIYRYWTLKEACSKAIGLGLSYPLKDVRISASPEGFAVEADGPWAVFQSDAMPGYVASAVASGTPTFILHRGVEA